MGREACQTPSEIQSFRPLRGLRISQLRKHCYFALEMDFRPLRGLRISQLWRRINPSRDTAGFRPLRGLRISQYCSYVLFATGIANKGFRPLRGLRISQCKNKSKEDKEMTSFRPLRGLRISQYDDGQIYLTPELPVSVPCGVFVFLNCTCYLRCITSR